MNKLSERFIIGALCAIGFGVALRLGLSYVLYHYFIDDAYISMRYAENFASGHGLVYNQGERVIGFTSPLFQILLACTKWLSRGVRTSLLLDLINYFLFAIAAWLSIKLFAWRKLLCVVPVLLLLYFPYIDASLSGMETMLLLVVILSTLDFLAQGKHAIAIVLATASVLVRPEGVFFLAIVGLYSLVKGKRFYWKSMLLGFLILLMWIVTTYAYYGSFLPQSMLAKSAHITKASWGGFHTNILDKNVLLAFGFSDIAYTGWSPTVRILLSGLALVGVGILCFSLAQNLREKSFLLVPPAFYLSLWAFYVAGQPIRIFSWYTIPTSLCFFIGLLDGLTRWIDRLQVRVPRPLVLASSVLGCVAVAFVAIPSRASYMKRNLPEMERFATKVGAIPGASSILLGDIGLVGYISGLRVIDSVGLVSPAVMNLAPADQIGFLSDLIEREKPSIICLETDPMGAETIKQSERLYRTFRDRFEAERFNDHYVRLSIPAGRYHYVFIDKQLTK